MNNRNTFSIALFAIILFIAASCGVKKEVKPTPAPPVVEVEVPKCHTELVEEALETSVLADEQRVLNNQTLSSVIKDHQRKVSGYTGEMFLADNPAIAGREKKDKVDPCTKDFMYRYIPLRVGEVIFLRHPFRIDTVSGPGESVNWEKERHGRIKHVIDMDEDGYFRVSDQEISCDGLPFLPESPDGVDSEIIPTPQPKPIDGGGDSGNFGNFVGDVPNWFWFGLLAFALLCWLIIKQHKNTREIVNKHTSEEVEKLTGRVNSLGNSTHDAFANLNAKVDGLREDTKKGFEMIVEVIKEEGKEDRKLLNQVIQNNQKTTESLIELLKKQGGLSGRKNK